MPDLVGGILGFMGKPKRETDFEYLNRKWSARHSGLRDEFHKKHGASLKWLVGKFSPEQLALSSLGGIMLLAIPGIGSFVPRPIGETSGLVADKFGKNMVFQAEILDNLPKTLRPLSLGEEGAVADILSKAYGFTVTAEIEGKRLNTNYGRIGMEQHLYRFPGDTLAKHFVTDEEKGLYERYGIAPGLGAWGYFSESETTFTERDRLREEYYVAVQTFLSPGFSANIKEYGGFFRYRKVLVFNPKNGRAVVGDIGDAGPAAWTGKQFGGSPAVMYGLGLADGSQKGDVLLFFIDDPGDKIPLGPLEMI